MHRIILTLMTVTLVGGLACQGRASDSYTTLHGLPLSDMMVRISSNGHIATFRLYDTTAGKDFYDQLPLRLPLTDFRDAQWMFYPPSKLKVTDREAYHNGKKGELSYYAPWGDVFMLHKDFQAGDEMHRLGINVSGLDKIAGMSGDAVIEIMEPVISRGKNAMHVAMKANGNEIVFMLNNSIAAKTLYAQLPLIIAVEDYSTNEKIFYPPNKLDTTNTPLAKDIRPGTLCYYAPWGDVVIFYDNFHQAPGLFELGVAIQGEEYIKSIFGNITIEPTIHNTHTIKE